MPLIPRRLPTSISSAEAKAPEMKAMTKLTAQNASRMLPSAR